MKPFEHPWQIGRRDPDAGIGDAQVDAAVVLVKLHADGTPRTKHVTTNVIVEIDDAAGTATARSYFTVFQRTDAVPLQAIVAGRYHDRFARAGEGWRFTDRLIYMDLVGDLHDHLRT